MRNHYQARDAGTGLTTGTASIRKTPSARQKFLSRNSSEQRSPAKKSKIKVDIKVDSVDTKHEGLDKHLKSPDFFNTVQFPTMSFASTAVNLNPAGGGNVAGNLTMHGVTKPVSFKLKQIGTGSGPKGDTRVDYVATATFKRSDFGISYGVPIESGSHRRAWLSGLRGVF